MAVFGLTLLLIVGAGIALTGLPAFLVIVGASVLGALVAMFSGVAPDVFSALPLRLGALLESDLFQAIPLYVLMGALLNRLPVADALFRAAIAVAPRGKSAPLVAGLWLGALLGPMNGSVGASATALARALAPRLAEAGTPPARRRALVAVASTLGVVVPPSLVLILLGDAMLSAHTIAVNATGSSARIVNTQDVFRGALIPALLFLGAATCAIVFSTRETTRDPLQTPARKITRGEIALSFVTLVALIGLLAAVASGALYVVEASATGALALFVAALASGRLGGGALEKLLAEVMAGAGALFALLIAATSLTLVLRVLGTDKLVAAWIAALPGSPTEVALIALAAIGAAAFVLDAFEIIFVVVPIVAPPLLTRAPDAVWVSVLILLTLQTSFLLPPFGYALMAVQSALPDQVAAPKMWRALAPYLFAQMATLAAVFAFPALTHLRDPATTARDAPVKIEYPKPPGDEPPPLKF